MSIGAAFSTPGQQQEWPTLAGSGFLSMRRVHVFDSYSWPIRFVRFDGNSVNHGLSMLDLTKRSAASGAENVVPVA